MTRLHYLHFDLSDNADGITTLEALAATTADHHAAVMAEVQRVLDWARARFGPTHGSIDDTPDWDWDHDLQVSVEDGRWHAVTLTLTGSARFVEAFLGVFGEGEE